MEKFDLDIIDLGMNFEGVGKFDSKVVFVPFALVGENVEAEVVLDKGKFMSAELVKINSSSKSRVEPFCPYFMTCGGCDIQHIDYETQLKLKKEHIKNTIKKIVGIDVDVRDVIPSDKNYFYRNKGVFDVGERVGMFKKNSHDVVEINQCFLMNDTITKAYKIVKNFVEENDLTGYDRKTHTGILKSIVIRGDENRVLVTLVVTKKIDGLKNLYKNLSAEFDEVGLSLNYNTLRNSIILTDKFEHIAGIKTLKYSEFGIDYELENASFLQVNNYIKSKIYEAVSSEVAGVVIDAYAGAGLLSAIVSKRAKFVYSVELNKSASKSAEKLKSDNNISNLEILNGDCAKVVPEIVKGLKSDYTIILDPAKQGCSDEVLNSVKSAKKIIYVSCNPIALSKDLRSLLNTHKIKYIQPFDMFPETKQVETLIVLEKI